MSAHPNLDLASLREEILAFHRDFIDAHVTHKPSFLVQDLSDDYVNVSRGQVLRQTKAEILASFTEYLGSTDFSEYSMPEEPFIGFSDDGSLAWSVFRLHVEATAHRPGGQDVDYEDMWACLILFRRERGRWVRIAEASNRVPR